MRGNNGAGYGRHIAIDIDSEYRAFDDLPPVLRESLRCSLFKYSALEVAYALEIGMTGERNIDRIRSKEERVARHDRKEMESGLS